MKLPSQDRSIALTVAPQRFCPRKLAPGQVKRYAHYPKPLLAYMGGCPGCGFIEMHMNDVAQFEEGADGTLLRSCREFSCLHCKRSLRIADGVFSAVTV